MDVYLKGQSTMISVVLELNNRHSILMGCFGLSKVLFTSKTNGHGFHHWFARLDPVLVLLLDICNSVNTA